MSGDPAPEPAPAPAPAPAGTTTAGAFMLGSNIWLTAGAVIAYSSYALWAELRKLARKKTKSAKVDTKLKEGTKLSMDNSEPEEGGTTTDKDISITHGVEYQLDESGSLQKQVIQSF